MIITFVLARSIFEFHVQECYTKMYIPIASYYTRFEIKDMFFIGNNDFFDYNVIYMFN